MKNKKTSGQVTMKHIAERANTSINTVSKALRNHPQVSKKKKQEILELVREMGYIPNITARTLRQQKSYLLGMVVGDNTNPYFATMIKTVQMKLKEYNYSLVTFNNYENIKDELRFVTELCGLRVAGVLLSPAMGNKKSAELLKRNNIPYVFINRAPEDTLDPYVMADDELAAYLATKHLIENKKERILFMNFYEGFVTSKMRCLGYIRALREYGMEDEYTWIVSNCTDRKDGYDTMVALLRTHKPPFSVLCFSDYIAIGAMSAIKESGYDIPADIAVMGIDDAEEMLNGAFGLSSIKIPVADIAESAVRILIEEITNKNDSKAQKKVAQQVLLAPELSIRRSTAGHI